MNSTSQGAPSNVHQRMPRSVGLILLCGFFVFGALMASLAFLALALPGGLLEPVWQLNPTAHRALAALGSWGVVMMGIVALACALAAIGLWKQSLWGHRLAVGMLVVNVLSDVLNAVVRGDLWTLIGVPIGGALIWYLLSARARAQFEVRSAAVKQAPEAGGTRRLL